MAAMKQIGDVYLTDPQCLRHRIPNRKKDWIDVPFLTRLSVLTALFPAGLFLSNQLP
jgi:hypothetical protein